MKGLQPVLSSVWIIPPATLLRMAGALAAILVLAAAFTCRAGASLTVQYNSDSSYSLDVKGLKDATSIEITIGYDSLSIVNPAVSKSMFTSRSQLDSVNDVGAVTITITRPNNLPFSGSGSLADLKFNKVGKLPGRLTFVTAFYRGRDERQYNMDATIVNPPEQPDLTDEQKKASIAEKSKSATVMNGSGITTKSSVITASASPPAGRTDPPGGRSSGEIATPAFIRIPSVLERFRNSAGKAGFSSLKELFSRENDVGIRQDPEVVLSDGTSLVTVTVPFNKQHEGGALNFNLEGAHLTHLGVNKDNSWELKLLPEKGSYAARLTIATDSGGVEFPLTVVPPEGRLPDPCPDYLRQYILAANCLASPIAGDTCRTIK